MYGPWHTVLRSIHPQNCPLSGDPQRYESRGVVRMAQSSQPYRDQRIEAPQEDIETEGERQLKVLIKRQLEKDVTFEGQLSRRKEFQASTPLRPVTGDVAGSLSLEAFRGLEEHACRLEELRQYGLTLEEMVLTLQAEGVGLDGQPAKRSRYGADPTAHTAKLEAIQRKISKKREELEKPDNFAGTRYMSRHEMDLERAISHNRDKSLLLGMLMTSDRPGLASEDPKDPINQLDAIMEDVREKAKHSRESTGAESDEEEVGDVATCAARPRWYRARNNIPYGDLCPLCRIAIPSMPRGQHDSAFLEDDNKVCYNCNQPVNHSAASNERKKTSPTEKGSDTKNKACAVQDKVIEPVPEDVIKRYRLTTEQIRQMPRFKDYAPGESCKTLYLKNLSGRVTEADLVSLFINFQQPNSQKITFKLMTGRMKGQAFITFDSEETATQALRLVNGYEFKGKPIIVQYGKKH